MRGKGGLAGGRTVEHGITPAYAGKRARPKTPPLTPRDHPRMCGEKSVPGSAQSPAMGSPPHVRGKGVSTGFARAYPRITPAYAGKRADAGWIWSRPPDHPRVCGEKVWALVRAVMALGSPPHVRGKVHLTGAVVVGGGITPAYAGKRGKGNEQSNGNGDHPRVCGEKRRAACFAISAAGSPPRMRGKDTPIGETGAMSGITPAYAGKRLESPQPAAKDGDHPRVCGEKRTSRASILLPSGSPPRMRGKVDEALFWANAARITPAYAGKREHGRAGAHYRRDHPRVCGEKSTSAAIASQRPGSPPRMRGKVCRLTVCLLRIRDHPRVCGEKTKKIP